jgi:hypothetical protein
MLFFPVVSGMYHYLIEDIPHALVVVSLLTSKKSDSCEDQTLVAYASLVSSVSSILFGVANKALQVCVSQTISQAVGSSCALSADSGNAGQICDPAADAAGAEFDGLTVGELRRRATAGAEPADSCHCIECTAKSWAIY